MSKKMKNIVRKWREQWKRENSGSLLKYAEQMNII